jgi:hypothetical protein|tara:strand:+ start:2932 stop:3138 length:207 start_codon:yes stop_codon:yes gene_type:complete
MEQLTIQTFTDDMLGGVKFHDKGEKLHSVKCRAKDIVLLTKGTPPAMKRTIAEDINLSAAAPDARVSS